MQVSAVSKDINIINFQANPFRKDKKVTENKDNSERKINQKQLSGYLLAATLSGALMAGALAHGKIKSQQSRIRNLMESTSWQETSRLQQDNKKLTEQVDNLTGERNKLQEIIDSSKEKFEEIFENDLTPKELREKILNQLKEKINKGELGYDILNPPVTGKSGSKMTDVSIPEIDLPSVVSTSNRAGMKELHLPEIGSDGKFSLEIPMSSEVQLTHESKNFRPVSNKESTIAVSYGNSVRWDSDKVARDLLQNFYDGHGQTLDGVKMIFTPAGSGRYKVRIEGKSTFTPDKAIYLGLSSKQFNAKAAGNYGEGIKMASLKLLTEAGANDVKIASDNWLCKWDIGHSELMEDEGEKVLRYSVDKLPEKLDGNFIEFETNNMELLKSLRKSVNRFYHSGNKDFECPQFENNVFGIKTLPNSDRGALYIAGQRFEFNGDYDGLKGVSLFLKEKLPKSIVDESRDRTSLNTTDLENIAEWLAKDTRTTRDEKIKVIKTLEKYWGLKNYSEETPMDEFLDKFLFQLSLSKYNQNGNFRIKFPIKYIAYSPASPDVVSELERKGYVVCKKRFADLGMPTIRDLYGDARKHDVVMPNEVEKKKIMIIREAIAKLAPSLKAKHFTSSELDTHIYMFDRTAPKERQLYNDCNAEAIVDFASSKGFWIDKGYLNKASFSEALETALHEMCHKAGGDESASFSYKLTDVNADAIGHILNAPQTKSELSALQTIWNSLA